MSPAKPSSSAAAARSAAAIAYFLSRRGALPIVIERHEIAGSASGKSGGFLALDWCRGSPLDRLARRSFALHAELAAELGNPWLYRRLDLCRPCRRRRDARRARRRDRGYRQRHDHGAPRLTADDGLGGAAHLHHGLDARCRGRGRDAQVRHGRDTRRSPSGAAAGVVLKGGEVVEGDAVVVAMGPWSILAARWLPLPAVFGFKGHSLIFRDGRRRSRRGAVPGVSRGRWRSPHARAVPRSRRHDVGVHDVDDRTVTIDPPKSRPMTARTRGSRRCVGAISRALAAAPIVGRGRPAPAGHRGRTAAHRAKCERGRRLRGDRP